MTAKDTAQGLSISDLDKVIRDEAGGLRSSLVTRREHPTYGETKTVLRSRLARLEGFLNLRLILVGEASHAHAPLAGEFVLTDGSTLNITAIREQVKSS